MYALDAKDGHIVWEFYMVPKGERDFARGPQAPDPPAQATHSWKTADGFPITGGGTWTSYTLDPASALLYVPGGNPAPDFTNEYRTGDNLFTDSVVVLDAKTGAYQRHFQMVKHDFHDWDASTAPVLFRSKAGRWLLAEAPKDGRLHLIDLGSGTSLYDIPVTLHVMPTRRLLAKALLPRLAGWRGVEQPRLRPRCEPDIHRRGRLVRDCARDAGGCDREGADGGALERFARRLRQDRRHQGVGRLDDRNRGRQRQAHLAVQGALP